MNSLPTTVSLFCGAGGESLGKHDALAGLGVLDDALLSYAVNHWDLAVDAHRRNLPMVIANEGDITQVTATTYGITDIALLWGSPSCVFHSRARGGKPKSAQQRAHPWEMTYRWLDKANVTVMLVENVPEFKDWGPLHETHSKGCRGGIFARFLDLFGTLKGKSPFPVCKKGCHFNTPIKARKGEFFAEWVADLRARGYEVDHRIICCADLGAPTTRRRFFLQAVKDGKGIHWPESTHRDPKKGQDMFTGHLPTWKTAASCIDWSIPCPSIFDRKKPLAPATLRRIAAGIIKFVIESKSPFIVPAPGASLLNLTHGGRLEGLDEPFKTITGANRGEKALIVPTIVGCGGRAGQSRPRGADEPFGTMTAKADAALVAASMINFRGTSPDKIDGSPSAADEPLRTVSAGGGHAGLVAAFLAKHYGGPNGNQTPGAPMDGPMGTVTAVDHHAVVSAFLSTYHGAKTEAGDARGAALEAPVPTLDTSNRHAVVAASLIQTGYGERDGQAPRALDIQDPLGTVVAGGGKHALVAANLIGIDNQSAPGIWDAESPLTTSTTKARHAVVAATLMTNTTGHAPTDLEDPMPTVTTGNHQALVAAFIQHYYGQGTQAQDPGQPLHTITCLARHGLVTVEIDGETWVIVDIGMRMLEPKELAAAMSFPPWYRWLKADGSPLTKRDQVKMIGNAVPPVVARALVEAVVRPRPEIFGLAEAIA